MLSYATMCNIIKPVLGDTKIQFTIKNEAQAGSYSLEKESNRPVFHAVPDLTVQTSAVSLFNQVPLTTMAKAQTKDSVLGLSFHLYIRG